MEGGERDRGDAFARWVGGALAAEAILLAMVRILTLVYVVAVQVYRADEEHLKKIVYVPYVLISIALVVILAWAGGQLHRTPAGAWREARVAGRIDLALAALLNVALAVWVGTKLAAGPVGKDGVVVWLIMVTVAVGVVIGLLRDVAGRARPTVE